ncbi:MAG: DEAD/DEAH box helicase [Atopobiaceae bacterium]|nr:DEAD/DEAH box helicase [Atopobiaceae bacterium]
MDVFGRYAPFIQDFIYSHDWEQLRAIQVAAGEALFETDDHVLLCASTASGKTEAAFFPILTELYEEPPLSVGALYIGPLKALINDQFLRLEELCHEEGIPIWHWHGDVSQSHKARLLKNPSGVLQITPESLESLLLHRHAAIPKLFCDLRYIVIDEVHSLLRGDRGGQTLCCIERLGRLAGVDPRRIGLSATIGEPELAAAYLAHGTNRNTTIPRIEGPSQSWRLSMEHFYVVGPQAQQIETDMPASLAGAAHVQDFQQDQDPDSPLEPEIEHDDVSQPGASQSGPSQPGASQSGGSQPPLHQQDRTSGQAIPSPELRPEDAHVNETLPALQHHNATSSSSDTPPPWADPAIGYIFTQSRATKSLIFCNSREEAEDVTTSLRHYCEAIGEPDRFLIHHGNLSQSLRESAEDLMRDDDVALSCITTATLELGIDIGKLEKAFQIDAPFTVSSFLQRMGRTGRRGQPSQMHFVMREDPPEARALLPETIPWKLLQGIALVQLYLKERWVEPPSLDRLPYSLLYHQTMATLASSGELSARELARHVLTLTPFFQITTDDFRELLLHLIKIEHIERTENDGLIVGLAGERVVNNFRFYAVFQENEEYTVRSESQELGTIVSPPPVGERIAIAGHVWVVEAIDHKRHLIECTQVKGKVPAYFGQVAGDVNTKVLERMRQALREPESYPYLLGNAQARLQIARRSAAHAQLADKPLVNLGGSMWCLLPWLGSYAFLALERLIKLRCAKRLGIKGVDSARPYFMQFKMGVSEAEFFDIVREEAELLTEPMDLLYPAEVPFFDKYDEYVPEHLIRKGFAYGILDIEGMKRRIREWDTYPQLTS